MKIISRKDALAMGLKRYFTGKPCPKGHVAERYVKSFTCVDCGKLQQINKILKQGGKRKKSFVNFCEIVKAARSSKNRLEMRVKYSSEYYAASKRGILKRVTTHMTPPKTSGKWNKKSCAKEALKFQSRSKFSVGSSGAYEAAIRLGMLDAICAHMDRPLTDADTLYIWGDKFRSIYICKVGITSKRLDTARLKQVSRNSPIDASFYHSAQLRDARVAEKEILKGGVPVNIGKFDGSTEFRVFCESQIERIKNEYFS